MEGLSPLELLLPETQALIMSYIPQVTSLHALLRASPRFYQVFRSRRDYHLTCLAVQHSLAPANTWDAVKASKLPKPFSRDEVKSFTQTFLDDEEYEAPILPTDITIPMIRLNVRVEWLVADFAQSSHSNMVRLGKLMDLQQDRDVMDSELSGIEKSRIARAFCRFETFRHLFPPAYEGEWQDVRKLQPGLDFLYKYSFDEIEEIACIRDYIIRRLWDVFDDIEDDLVQGQLPEPIQKAALELDDRREDLNWFGPSEKSSHTAYMEQMMSYGLTFLKDVFTADPARRAQLVLAHRTNWGRGGFLTDTLSHVWNEEPFNQGPNAVHYLSSYHDTLTDASIGWYWAVRSLAYYAPCSPRKGLRDWGYVFWDKERIIASGVLKEASRHRVSCFVFQDHYRELEPCALLRLKNPQIKRVRRKLYYEKPGTDTPEEDNPNLTGLSDSGYFGSPSFGSFGSSEEEMNSI